MADTQKRIDELRQKRVDTKRHAKDKIAALKATVKDVERQQLDAIDRKLRRAESRLRGQARRDDTRRKILIGAALLSEATHNPQFKKWLAGDFSAYLTRDRDRALFGLDPSSAEVEPLPDFYPKTLPDGSWGAEFTGDTSSLPHVLVGRQIRVTPKSVEAWTATVTEVIECDADHVKVRHSGKPTKRAQG
ncbi:MAG: hypothetical protein OXL36_06635 [Bryobacterales bacterium]|nr:hypothetical protein [Bryobacterales bacterium]MDE0296609.1 hypothetical protein [Bryobacterales bacterium]